MNHFSAVFNVVDNFLLVSLLGKRGNALGLPLVGARLPPVDTPVAWGVGQAVDLLGGTRGPQRAFDGALAKGRVVGGGQEGAEAARHRAGARPTPRATTGGGSTYMVVNDRRTNAGGRTAGTSTGAHLFY